MVKNKELDIELPADHQFAEIFAELRQVIDDLEHGAVVEIEDESGRKTKKRTPSLEQFLLLAAAALRDGFPTATMQGSSRSSVLDEDGHAIPPISDPVGELASAESRIVDPIRATAQSVLRGLTDGLGDLRLSRGALIRGSRYAKVGPGDPGCTSHARIGRWVEVYKDGRCNWCYKHRLVWLNDPPVDIVRMKDDGRIITDAMIREALAPSRSTKKTRARR